MSVSLYIPFYFYHFSIVPRSTRVSKCSSCIDDTHKPQKCQSSDIIISCVFYSFYHSNVSSYCTFFLSITENEAVDICNNKKEHFSMCLAYHVSLRRQLFMLCSIQFNSILFYSKFLFRSFCKIF